MDLSVTPRRRLTPVPFTRVRIDDSFWAPRLQVNREQTLPAEYRQCKETGRIDAFALDWQPGIEPVPHIFWDSDVAKWVEAASYSLATHPDTALAEQLDDVVDLIISAQQPDGYLNIYYTVVEPEKRWSNLRDCHELYCAGHLIESAVAHFQATGNRRLLNAMCRYADYIASVFGAEPGKKRGYCGHEEIELALVKLYHATGEERYLQLSRYFVDERGRQPHYYDLETRARGEAPEDYWAKTYAYCQAHLPVREQTEVGGHAVRAMYLYSAMADLAAELGDESLKDTCERLWTDLCHKRMYLTGGIGPSRHNEGFTAAFDLPNETAYAETCAAIGLVFWAHRMLQLDGDGRYADVMERALYNGVISGVSLDGQRFFYENPLASNGTHHRQDWFGCACCPPNLARLLASLGGYIYSQDAEGLTVHLYIQGETQVTLANGATVTLQQQTTYPWSGKVQLRCELSAPVEFTLRLRVPGWCRRYKLRMDDYTFELPSEKGYVSLTREWNNGDVLELELDMPVEHLVAHPAVHDDRGLVALQRGPLVYCLEAVDHDVNLRQITIPDDAFFGIRYLPDLLGGVVVLEGEGCVADERDWQDILYQPLHSLPSTPVAVRAIPYCTWDNREPGEMAVWLQRI